MPGSWRAAGASAGQLRSSAGRLSSRRRSRLCSQERGASSFSATSLTRPGRPRTSSRPPPQRPVRPLSRMHHKHPGTAGGEPWDPGSAWEARGQKREGEGSGGLSSLHSGTEGLRQGPSYTKRGTANNRKHSPCRLQPDPSKTLRGTLISLCYCSGEYLVWCIPSHKPKTADR